MTARPTVFDNVATGYFKCLQLLHNEIILLADAGVKTLVTFAVYGSSGGTEPLKFILETVDEHGRLFCRWIQGNAPKDDIFWVGGLPALCTSDEIHVINTI